MIEKVLKLGNISCTQIAYGPNSWNFPVVKISFFHEIFLSWKFPVLQYDKPCVDVVWFCYTIKRLPFVVKHLQNIDLWGKGIEEILFHQLWVKNSWRNCYMFCLSFVIEVNLRLTRFRFIQAPKYHFSVVEFEVTYYNDLVFSKWTSF